MTSPESKIDTRDRLIQAAGEVFADKGFRAATIREITKRAAVNLAAVNYHFNDKEELYSAVLLYAHQCAMETDWVSNFSIPREDQLHQFIEGMLRHLFDSHRPKWQSQLMAREMATPTRMLHQLLEEGLVPKVKLLETLVLNLLPSSIPEKTLHQLCLSILAQCLFYRQSKPVIDHIYPEILNDPDPIPSIARHITLFSLAGIRSISTNATPFSSH